MIPLLTIAIPGLIKLAEGLFSKTEVPGVPGVVASQGSLKKDFVMKALEFIYDQGIGKLMHDFPGVDEKRLFLRTCDVWIEELVPVLTK